MCFTFPVGQNAMADSVSVATQNAYNFFNDQRDGKREKVISTKNYRLRLKRMAKHIVTTLKAPDILALQEIENFSTLNDLKKELRAKFDLCYQVVLLNGHSKVAINVGYLVNCHFDIKNLSQLFKKQYLSNHKNRLFTRPPLYLKVCKKRTCLHLVNLHLRSMIGLNNRNKKHYVAQKRLEQAQHIARWVNQFQFRLPNEKLIVLGDFNALKVSDRFVDVLGIIKGKPSSFYEAFSSKDLIQRDLFDLSLQIPLDKRYSYRYRKKNQSLDYLLVSKNLVSLLTKINYTKINYKVSDHAGLMANFELPN